MTDTAETSPRFAAADPAGDCATEPRSAARDASGGPDALTAGQVHQ